MRKQRGITLISLVITIVVLIILAGVAINMTLGENGIFNKAQEAKRMQAIATAKEQIGLEILEAQIEAMENNEELEQSEVETIVAKYGALQADGDTIILNDTEYEVSLRDIYNTMAETETDGDTTTELAQLKALLAQTTVTEDKILKDYKAYKDGQLITGTMEDYAGQTVEAATITESGENAEIAIPQAGYYDTTSKISIPIDSIKQNIPTLSGGFDSYYVSYYLMGYRAGDTNYFSEITIKDNTGTVVFSDKCGTTGKNYSDGGGFPSKSGNVTLPYKSGYTVSYTLRGRRDGNSDIQSYVLINKQVIIEEETFSKQVLEKYSGTTNKNYYDGGGFPSNSGSSEI